MFPTQEHIDAAQKAADHWFAKTGHYAWPSVALAQAADESDYWTHLAAPNNGFGITATKAEIEAGQARYRWTHEFEGGRLVPKQRWFAAYASLEDAYMAHARILTDLSVYHDAWSAPDADTFLARIAPHYASAPNYAGVIRGYMRRLDTYSYDRKPAAPARKSPLAHPAVAPAASVAAAVAAIKLPGLVPWETLAAGGLVAAVVTALVLWTRHAREAAVKARLAAPALAPPPPPGAPVAGPPPPPAAPAVKLPDPIAGANDIAAKIEALEPEPRPPV